MLKHRFDVRRRLLFVEPEDELAEEDFRKLAKAVDGFIRMHGDLNGVVIHADAFPGWEDFGAFTEHLTFIRPPAPLWRSGGRRCHHEADTGRGRSFRCRGDPPLPRRRSGGRGRLGSGALSRAGIARAPGLVRGRCAVKLCPMRRSAAG